PLLRFGPCTRPTNAGDKARAANSPSANSTDNRTTPIAAPFDTRPTPPDVSIILASHSRMNRLPGNWYDTRPQTSGRHARDAIRSMAMAGTGGSRGPAGAGELWRARVR